MMRNATKQTKKNCFIVFDYYIIIIKNTADTANESLKILSNIYNLKLPNLIKIFKNL